jgi:putative DNA primase/helicase
MDSLVTDMMNPNFNFDDICKDANKCINEGLNEIVLHNDILDKLLEQIQPIDFKELAELGGDVQPGKKHYLVISIEQILTMAVNNNWGICKNHDFIYLYNGAYWKLIEGAEIKTFLGEASEKMGVYKFDARLYSFRSELFNQFIAVANLPKPEGNKDTILVNLKNGTFEISPDRQILRQPQRSDFITYQLPFDYNLTAKAPMFENYLDKVQPDKKRQLILAEYIGYLFIKSSTLKLEKTLLLYGTGANGKSVFFEIVNALLGGDENVSNYSLQNLTNDTGYFRAMLANKLVNYASEINGKLEASIFKQLVSGEPVDARLPYGKPFTLTDYAKLIFNCNELPKDTEHTNAFFRRFLIVPFDITIPDEEQDKELPKKIIQNELSGVFNWVLDGLRRILTQKNFTPSEAVSKQLEDYKKQSDNVQMFIEDENYVKSLNDYIKLKDLYAHYREYCNSSGYHSCSIKTIGDRLKNLGFNMERKNSGQVVFVKKENVF